MPIIYPDNPNRQRRVQQLAAQIQAIQLSIATSIANETKEIKDIQDQLVATLEPGQTLESLEKKAREALTDKQRKAYDDMIKNMQNAGNDVTSMQKVFGGIAGVAAGVGGMAAGANTVYLLYQGCFSAGLSQVGRGMLTVLSGDASAGLAAIRSGYGAIKTASAAAADEGIAISEGVAEGLSAIKVVGFALAVLGLVVEGILLIVQIVEDSKLKDALQEATVSLCSRRWNVKYLQMHIDAYQSKNSEIYSYVYERKRFNKKVKAGKMTQAEADAELRDYFDDLKADVEKEVKIVTMDSAWDKLHEFDTLPGTDSWMDEDPDKEKMKAFLKKLEEENKKNDAAANGNGAAHVLFAVVPHSRRAKRDVTIAGFLGGEKEVSLESIMFPKDGRMPVLF